MLYRLLVSLLCLAVVLVGALGAAQYGITFWLYRGFPAPKAPATVVVTTKNGNHKVRVAAAKVMSLTVKAPSLGGWEAPVTVVLPPGYAQHPWLSYPVLYLLHGTPGAPSNFITAGDLVPTYEVLLAERRMQPMIIVLPSGARGFLSDSEWANGVLPDSAWETYLSQTVVSYVDDHFRTIDSAAGRGIGGLSEGGYGALNIAFHHPGEFSLIESWSGYEHAFDITDVFGGRESLLRYNSPADQLPVVSRSLRSHHVFVWFYVGTDDALLKQNEAFCGELATYHVPYHFESVTGRHSWALWRQMMASSLVAASDHLSHG